MKKILRGTDRILLTMAFLGDLYIEGWTRGHGFGKNRNLLEALDIKNSTFQAEVARFLKTKEIEKVVDKKGRPCLRLSSEGYGKIERLYPLYRLCRKAWDGKWRIVIFDIPEEERKDRDSLRFKLISLGFGKLQESVYITPLDVLADLKEFLKERKLYGKAIVFEAKEVFDKNYKVIAAHVWKLNELNEKYRELISERNWLEGNSGTKEDKEKLRSKLFQVILIDPLLPKEFLLPGWLGEEARNKILSI